MRESPAERKQTSSSKSGGQSRRKQRDYVLLAVAMIAVAVVFAVMYLVLQPRSEEGGPPSKYNLTITNDTTMTWTLYGRNTNTSSVPFETYTWDVILINGQEITVNQTTRVISSGNATYQTIVMTKDDFRFGPAGVTDTGLSEVGTNTISTPFGPRNCTEFEGSVTYLIYSANVLIQQGTSNGVAYATTIEFRTGTATAQVSYVLTAGNIPEL